ncbi:MAG: hypothetical protein ACI9CP_001164 [Cryomorphaceae bacterium]|jgi:hypothetical protein
MPEMIAQRLVLFLFVITVLQHSAFSQDSPYPFVHKEYFHEPIFENGQIRVLNVSASRGDTTAFHRHCYPILYITLKGTMVSLKEPSSKWKEVELPAGWIGHDLYQNDSCYVHRFAISGDGNLHIVAIEALEESEPISLGFAPTYMDEGFSVFEIDSSHLTEVTKSQIPIILIDRACSSKCKVKVIRSKKLSNRVLKKHKGYAVFFQEQL